MNPKVDFYFMKPGAPGGKSAKWQEEFLALRKIMLTCGLREELKWGHPCYMHGQSNIVLMHGFKSYCALLFFKGAILQDPEGILVRQTENVQAARQIRFDSVKEIVKMRSTLKSYIKEAIGAEKAGLKVTLKKTREFVVPEEFQQQLNETPVLKTAFKALSPGRQRAYLLYFSSAKQAKTRAARVEKCLQQILEGKGLDD